MSPVNIERSINVRTATYNFVSGIFHEGDYADSGHYTCVAMRSDGKLMHYDDAVVSSFVKYTHYIKLCPKKLSDSVVHYKTCPVQKS